MPRALSDLAHVHLALCELLESPVISSVTRSQVEVLKEAVQKELEALKNEQSGLSSDA
jgi:hypothetical protein